MTDTKPSENLSGSLFDPSATLAGKTIMVVDDVKLFRAGVRALLETYKASRIVEAIDGESAVALYSRHQPDVVLMDIGLPGISGIEATKQLREKYPDSRIVMLTSHDAETEVLDAFASGANAYSLKNIDERIIDVILTVCEGSVWVDGDVAGAVLTQLKQKNGSQKKYKLENPETLALNERDIAILKLISEGKNNPAIAQELHVSVHTVRVYVSQIFEKLGVEDRTQAAVQSVRKGLI